MSLEDLLAEGESTSTWKNQRKKLIRIVLGMLVITIGLVAGVVFLFFIRENKIQKNRSMSLKQEQEIKSVAGLLNLQKETKALQEEIHGLRSASNTSETRRKHTQYRHKKLQRGGGQLLNESISPTQIINFEPGDGFTTLDTQKESLYIPTGAVFRARLITPIKTSVERTFVLAETTNEFRMDMKRRIPKGSRLIGRSRLNPILKGVIVEFDTLVLPNGIETSLSGLALSRNALPEIDGLYFSDDLQNYGAALAFGFLSGFADASRTKEPTPLGYQVPEDSVSNKVLSGLSTASFQVAENILQDIRSKAIEYVVVPAGEPVFVALTRRYDLNQRSSK